MDILISWIVRGVCFILRVLPVELSINLVRISLKTFVVFSPKLRQIARTNLELAFPSKDETWRETVLSDSYTSLARLVVDSARLPAMSPEWIKEHVEFPRQQEYADLKSRSGGKGLLIATGHLGSFEVLAHASAQYGYPLAFIVRNFKLPALDNWWIGIREANGNKVIDRKGAYREAVRYLKSGTDVGILFDQNVTRNRAVFVDFFGTPAATTKALGLAAIQVESPVLVASIAHVDNEQYRINWKECEVADIYSNRNLSREEKVLEITSRTSVMYEEMVRADPPAWFWMHRRWKTRPSEADQRIY